VLWRGRLLLMEIARAVPGNLPAVEALLTAAGLPLEGAAEALALGVVAREDDTVVAAAAIERYGDAGLLRSVVVDADHRGSGLGRAIVTAAEDLARGDGIRDLFLLTETAVDWFPRLGYGVVARQVASAAVGASIEFTTVCRDTGVPMRKHLDGGTDPIRVLFLCTHNSARSQLAEALLAHEGSGRFLARSAGTERTRVNPYAVRVLAERGIDWSGARSKVLTEFLGEPWDYVITVCDRARQACPIFPGATTTLHWGLADPSEVEGTDEERLAAFRRTADEVSYRLASFVATARPSSARVG
jgi:protein-tyrosine-phosphatase/N-acetylglutamate synthase-like GNAT family acetyltransferase